ncbi:putative fad dependent oxidoreductase [Diplodia seriata]|uniref:Putative fad dependent oxidoreductase n=1 Tax=Diplodia seriata TaxID=420778 RepID=A0A0G2EBA8_9PEZI|nr:putative fad dependent oxidoreductase [Diplodia seriata]
MTSSEHKPAGLPVPNSTSSFWHSEPNQFLLGHRTTAELPAEADFVIVGSGITGTSTARFLAEDERTTGKSIVLLEAREACHCQVLPVARALDVTQFEVLNYNAVKAYIEENDVPCEWRSLDGCRGYYSADMFSVAQAEVAALQDKDPELGKLVRVVTDKDELAAHRISKAVGCTLTSAAASLWPYKLVTFILEKLVKAGRLNLQTNTPVESISSTGTDAASSSSSSHPRTLHTPRGAIRARTVILATNGYTSHLLPNFADLIVPVRGEMSSLLPPPNAPRLADSYGLCGQPGQPSHGDDYLNQRPYEGVPNPAGHYMYGGGDGAAQHNRLGVWDDSVVDEGMAGWLRRRLLEYMELGGETEGLEELKATHQWTGIMGYSRDNVPWVGKVPGVGVWLAGGYTGHGMPNGTLCGKAIVELALADQDGVPASEAQQKVVKEVGLPKAYLITEDRFAEVRKMPTVAEADALGAIGNHARQEAQPKPRTSGIFEYVKSFVTSSSK